MSGCPCHRQDHLAEILASLDLRGEGHLADLGDALDEDATSRPNLVSISAIVVPVSSGRRGSRPAMIV